MNLSFHHFFVFVPSGAKVVDHLSSRGFTEGERNSHPGQGTTNRRIFFDNGMIEFIWVSDSAEITGPLTAPTKLWARSQSLVTGFSPFGICLCPSDDESAQGEPFKGWAYLPKYLPPEHQIWIASNEDQPWEPMIFSLPFARPFKKTIRHPNGARLIDNITITGPINGRELSDGAHKLKAVKGLALVEGPDFLAEIRLKGPQEAIHDLTKWCPLKIVITNN